jgi:TetR/AcrR family transcriptional regulator
MADQRYSDSEEAIFRAAIEEFGKMGKTGARMKAIANGAGVNKALIHYYFRDKDHLYDAVFDFVFARFMETLLDAVRDTETFDDVLWSVIDRYMDFLNKYNQYPLLLQQEFDTGGETWQKKYSQVQVKYKMTPSSVFKERMREAVNNGEIRNVDPLQTWITVLGACAYTFIAFPMIQCMHPDVEQHRNKFLQERKKHIYDLIEESLKVTGDNK